MLGRFIGGPPRSFLLNESPLLITWMEGFSYVSTFNGTDTAVVFTFLLVVRNCLVTSTSSPGSELFRDPLLEPKPAGAGLEFLLESLRWLYLVWYFSRMCDV